ncbi:hypothetical protein D3C71_1936860 [compost metagenome]
MNGGHQFVRYIYNAGAEAEVLEQLGQNPLVLANRKFALHPQRLPSHIRGYRWIAVPVAADPGTEAQIRWHVPIMLRIVFSQTAFQLLIHFRQYME